MQIFGGIFRHAECFGTWPTQHNNSDSPSTKWNRRSVLVTCAAILITGFQNKFFQMWCLGPSAPCIMKRPSIYKKFSGICHDIDKFWHPNSSFSHKFSLCYCCYMTMTNFCAIRSVTCDCQTIWIHISELVVTFCHSHIIISMFYHIFRLFFLFREIINPIYPV